MILIKEKISSLDKGEKAKTQHPIKLRLPLLEYTGTMCKVNPVTTEEYIKMMNIVQAKRPKNSQMSKEKLKGAGIEVPEWEDALKRYLKEEGKM